MTTLLIVLNILLTVVTVGVFGLADSRWCDEKVFIYNRLTNRIWWTTG